MLDDAQCPQLRQRRLAGPSRCLSNAANGFHNFLADQQAAQAVAAQLPRIPAVAHAISWRLEPRDYVIAHLLAEHRFLTTEQITAVLFTSPRPCRNRLDALRRLSFIDWFMPVHPRHGRLPVHWVPGRLSARYVARYHGEPAPGARRLREQRDVDPSVATRVGHLLHTDGVNQFFIDLLRHARSHSEAGAYPLVVSRPHIRQGQPQHASRRARRLARSRPAGRVSPRARHGH
jgi:hypothetical protein